MIRYAYELKDFRRWAHGLRKLPQITGNIRTGDLYTGISWLIIDVSLRDDLIVAIQPSTPPALFLQFDMETNHPSLRLSTTDNALEKLYLRNTRIRKIGILVGPAFLRHYLFKEIRNDLLRQAGRSTLPYTEPIPFEYRPLLDEVFHADPYSPLHHLLQHNRLLLVVEKFL